MRALLRAMSQEKGLSVIAAHSTALYQWPTCPFTYTLCEMMPVFCTPQVWRLSQTVGSPHGDLLVQPPRLLSSTGSGPKPQYATLPRNLHFEFPHLLLPKELERHLMIARHAQPPRWLISAVFFVAVNDCFTRIRAHKFRVGRNTLHLHCKKVWRNSGALNWFIGT